MINFNLVTDYAKDAVRYFSKDEKKYTQAMQKFYEEGKKSPSVARIIMHDEIIRGVKNIGENQKQLTYEADNFKSSIQEQKPATLFGHMIKKLVFEDDKNFHGIMNVMQKQINCMKMLNLMGIWEKEPPAGLKILKQDFENAFNSMYPKTGQIRKNLIEYNIRMNKVNPRFAKENRRFILEPANGWFSIYPKTYYTRMELQKKNKPVRDMNLFEKLKFSKIFKRYGQKKAIRQSVEDMFKKLQYSMNI